MCVQDKSAWRRLCPAATIALVVLCVVSVPLSAQLEPSRTRGLENEIVIGGEEGWNRILSATNAEFRRGRGDRSVAVLRDQRYVAVADTDLLLPFDGGEVSDLAGNYQVTSSDVDVTLTNSRRGDAAARFRSDGRGIALRGGPRAAFRPGRVWDSFSVEFWLYPARLEDGDQLLHWRGSRAIDDNVIDQLFSVSLNRGVIRWNFRNIFILPDFEEHEIAVESVSPIVPRSWSHHRLEFDAQSGMLEYLVDGQPEAIAYATDSGEPRGSVRIPHLGGESGSTLHVGERYAGLMDELRIEEFSPTPALLERYGEGAGIIITESYDLRRRGARIRSLEQDRRLDEGTDSALFMRTGDTIDEAGNVAGDWNAAGSADEIIGQRLDRFVQFRIELYPDGAGERTAEYERLMVRILPNRAPGPPGNLRAEGGDGTVTLRWNEAPGADVEGYRLYYGNRPGRYFGEDAEEGPSPIDLGDTTEFEVSGLENGRQYFFSIVGYDDVDDGEPSEEIPARPRAR